MTLDELKRFRQIDSKTAGHPEYRHANGIETTTGPLGQGVANSVGFAVAERILNSKFGDDLCNHFTYVFMGDGCLMEGISEEAISMAGHYKLGHLIAFWDNNSITIDGPTRLAVSDIEIQRFRASGWHVKEIDGHDTDAIRDAITAARSVTNKPSLIACKTIIGFGFPTKAGTEKAHSDAPGEDEIAGAEPILIRPVDITLTNGGNYEEVNLSWRSRNYQQRRARAIESKSRRRASQHEWQMRRRRRPPLLRKA
jgi:transketolase